MTVPESSLQLRGPRGTLDLRQPVIMGILNTTPDSFSDGGRYADVPAALAQAERMLADGAGIIDIGGESTRPGAQPVSLKDELARVMPVLERLRVVTDAWISVDTTKPEVMRAAAAAGADMINDVTALAAPGAAEVVADASMAVCLMHMQGEPRSMQADPRYDDVVGEVSAFLADRRSAAIRAGVAPECVCLDPGFGFGKTLAHNLELLGRVDTLCALPAPLLIGISRKSMFRTLLNIEDPLARMPVSVVAAAHAVLQGATIVRTHDVKPTFEGVALAAALRQFTPQAARG